MVHHHALDGRDDDVAGLVLGAFLGRALDGADEAHGVLLRFLADLEDPFWTHRHTLSSAPSAKPVALFGQSRATELLVNQWGTVWGNEQLPVAGVEMPDFVGEDYITWGVIEGTQIGYIYVASWHWEDQYRISEQWAEAIDELGAMGFLEVLRQIQRRTGGFTEFVPLPFVHMGSPIWLRGEARPGPTWDEVILVHAVSRIAFLGLIDNIQASWVKLGLDGAEALLDEGALPQLFDAQRVGLVFGALLPLAIAAI